jgi:hypothetical protein
MTTNKETTFSLHSPDNYRKELNISVSELVNKIQMLTIEYLNFIYENISIKNKDYIYFIVLRGYNTLLNVFRNLLYYTKNIDLTYFHCQKSFYYYIEFVSQILEEDKTFLQLTSRDATVYVYKKTIYDINNEIKKNINNTTSKETKDKIITINKYIDIIKLIVQKIISSNKSLNVDRLHIEKLYKLINKINEISISFENIEKIEKIIDIFYNYVENVDDFFDLCLAVTKKFSKTNIPQIYNKLKNEYYYGITLKELNELI